MDTVRIGFFLGELHGLSCCACDIGNSFCMERQKERIKYLLVQSLVNIYMERIKSSIT
jgi:hypothetical protein